MSSQNTFPGQNNGRPLARPTTQTANSQPSWVNPQAQPVTRAPQQAQQPANSWPPQDQRQQPAPHYPDYPQQGYATPQSAPQQTSYDQWNEPQRGGGNQGGYGGGYPQDNAGQHDPYAPQFEPYVPPSRPNYTQPAQQRQPQASPSFAQPQQSQPAQSFRTQQPQQAAPQWPAPATEPRFDAGNYGTQQPSYPAHQPAPAAPSFGQQQYHENELSAADWAGPHDSFGQDPYQQHQHGDAQLGFAQADGGELEPVYSDEEYEYEDEEAAPRSRRPLMIVAALVGAIVIGGGMAYGYKKLTGGGHTGDPPVIKSDDYAAKTKPADAGGKQFPYSDTKIMGRLGDGTSSAAAGEANGASAGTSDNTAQDPDGPRKVSTLVVGRDGSIMAPATPTQDQAPTPSQGGTAVPGTSIVDVFGQQQGGGNPPPAPAADNSPSQPRAENANDAEAPRKVKPVKITTINGPDADTPPPPKKKYKKVARAEPTVETDAASDAPPVTTHSGTGFVAVLASIPHSSSSRIDALKRFADMQQKYSSALAGRTPDIASANLSKGVYDRLVVGPPGSREQASNVCVQLKAQGYHGCWVTSY